MTDITVHLPFAGAFPLTQGFGENPQVYRPFSLPGHEGLDWGVPTGTPILAVDAGAITKAYTVPGSDPKTNPYGLHLKLAHSWGETVYAHLSRVDVKLNDVVKSGQQLGLSGSTGNTTGPHLHFGLRLKGYDPKDGWFGYTNPDRYLAWPQGADPALITDLNRQVQQAREALATAQGGFDFQRHELSTQAGLWREQVAGLLRRYNDNDLPPSADLLSSLELLLQNNALAAHLQESQAQADFWRERVTDLARRYTPGQLPANADVLATLEALLHAWSQEIEQGRKAQVAAFTIDTTIQAPFWPPATGRRGSR